jgi:hypothetical protein
MASTEDTSAPKRPLAITIICVIGLLGALVAVPLIFSQTARNIGAWYPPYLAVSAVIGAASLIGLWMMRNWAVYLYTTFGVLNQLVLFYMGVWNPFALLIPGVVIVVMFLYLDRMR